MTKVGIIGAGGNATGHAEYYAADPRTRVVAIADPDRGRGDALATKCGARWVSDYREFLDDVDAVVVSSPNWLHVEHATAAARAGRHVYCEKPMGLNLAEAQQIAAAVADAKVVSAVGFAVRFDPPIQTMARLAREGTLGQLRSLWSRRVFSMGSGGAPWRTDPGRSGGVLYEINLHELDWLLAIGEETGGRLTSVYARTWAADSSHPRANDHNWVTLGFAGGATATHEGSWSSPTVNFYRGVEGSAASAVTNEWGNELFLTRLGQPRGPYPCDKTFDLRGHFLDCIEHKLETVASVARSLRVMAVAEAVFESSRTGEAMDF